VSGFNSLPGHSDNHEIANDGNELGRIRCRSFSHYWSFGLGLACWNNDQDNSEDTDELLCKISAPSQIEHAKRTKFEHES